jgi:DNA polymerase-3 subunit alpha
MKDEKPQEDFVSLHTHSDMSTLDGLGKASEYIAAAAARKAPAIAFTDHGTMRGYIQQQEHCSKFGIKPIFGLEFYVSPDMTRKGLTDEEKEEIFKGKGKRDQKSAQKAYEEETGLRDRWHITVWAATQQGLQNLYRLSSAAWVEGFYYKPRIDIDTLAQHNEGLMVATGCLASPIHEQYRSGKKRAALDFANKLHETFADRMYLEIQPHAIDIQREANELMLKFRERYPGTKLLATQDAHYVEKHDAPHHDCLLCIGTNAKLTDTDRFRFDGDEFYFKTRKQMWNSFKRNHKFIPDELIKEALDQTLEFAERCSAVVEIDYKKALLPDPGIPEKYKGDSFKHLKDLCLDGWTWRQISKRSRSYATAEGISPTDALGVYAARLKEELGHIKNLRFERYFLMVRDIYREARERKIMVGPGRGSVGGSLVAYLLGITAVDPIEHGLLFERFINPDRKDLPDIDMDFEDHRREELIAYMRQKYGANRVCQIATIGRLSAKQCFKDVARVLDVPYAEVNKLTPSMIERPKHDPREYNCIEDSFNDLDVFKDFHEKYPLVRDFAVRIEGKAKSLGVHPAGVIASPIDLRELVPLETRKGGDEKIVVTALDMEDVPKIGLVKLDFLGLRTLTVISNCVKKIEELRGEVIDLEAADFDLNDKKVLQAFTDHDFVGVFQYDSASSDKVAKGVTFDRFADIATVTALNRPGTSASGMDEKFKARKANPKLLKQHDFHPTISAVSSDTLGVLVYQEHAIKIFREAGFSAPEADNLRRAIGKKLSPEEINKHRAKFVAGAIEHIGMKEEDANRLMDAIVFFSGYSFNKSHATEYGLIAYWTQWLKVYYPLEFFWSLLLTEPKPERVQDYAREAKRRGIDVQPPYISTSQKNFSIAKGAIWGSLSNIKGVGDGAAADIVEKQPFTDFVDFALRVQRKKCNKGTVQALIKSGAFGTMVNVRWLLDNLDEVWKRVQKVDTKVKKGKGEEDVIMLRSFIRKGCKSVDDFDREELALMMAEVSPVSFGAHPIDAYKTFIKREIKVHVESMEGEDYYEDWNNKGHFVLGMIKGVKKHQMGDFGDIDDSDPNFGKPYANVNIEDRTGTERRIKFAHYNFAHNQEAINAGNSKPLLVHCTAFDKFSSIRAHFAVDVARLRMKLKTGEELNVWEEIAVGLHPARSYEWKDDDTKEDRIQNLRFFKRKSNGPFAGVITHVEICKDKHGEPMARFGMLDAVGHYIRVIAFASSWGDIERAIKPGAFLRLEVERKADKDGSWSYFFDGGKVKVYRRSTL